MTSPSVEALADMTPEQLEAIDGIGPKTIEKISIAVNNYFASVDGVEAVATEESENGEAAPAENTPAEEAPAGESEAAPAADLPAPGESAPDAEPAPENVATPENVAAPETGEDADK